VPVGLQPAVPSRGGEVVVTAVTYRVGEGISGGSQRLQDDVGPRGDKIKRTLNPALREIRCSR